ncbi:hypothetical protein FLAG1_11029 [Fusarium langsethiae]|uniref:Uncharacterized protein n=1 Tax=Fusarium langsethiae TaxID=179993 RepID=A0A0N0DB45_FUSLA|nr:hypothetical protein FLAG1_11029 [Fusarium langsethiae]GKU08234.1 unnamed protein product [Fusarium langsethiae]GKU09686.1 unnamed protein product [Fusarium langsethiae]
MSTVIVAFTDKMLHEDVLKHYPALAADAQGVITHVLALANEAGDPEECNMAEATSPNNRHEFSAAQDSGFSELAFHSSPMQTDMMNIDQQSAMFMTGSSSPYSHDMGDSTIACTIFQDPTLSEIPYLPPSTLLPSLGPVPWNTSKPLSPTSFTYRLTHSCFNVGLLLLEKSQDSPFPLSDETRVFGATLGQDERESMKRKLRWITGIGSQDIKLAALLPWGGRYRGQNFTGDDLSSVCKTTDRTALRFLSAAGIQEQLGKLDARIVAQDTLELDLGGAMSNDEPRPLQPDSWSFVNFFPPDILTQKGKSAKIRCVSSDGARVPKEGVEKSYHGLKD